MSINTDILSIDLIKFVRLHGSLKILLKIKKLIFVSVKFDKKYNKNNNYNYKMIGNIISIISK
jgi:hypothetical protein